MSNKRKINPEAILQGTGKQTLQYATLDRMLCDYGFVEARKTGGDHTHYKHEDSGITVGIIMGPNSVVYQKSAAQACLDVLNWQEQQRNIRQAQITEKFSASAQSAVTGARSVEDFFSADKYEVSKSDIHDDICLVRLKDRPQIGTITSPKISASQAQAIITELDGQKIELEPLLREMITRFEFSLKEDGTNRTITLSHDYDPNEEAIILEAYDPDNESPLDKLKMIKNETELYDKESVQWILQQTRASNPPPRKLSDGRLEWSIPFTHFISQEQHEIKLVTTPGGRMSSTDTYHYLQQILEFERGSEKDPRRLKTILVQSFGANVNLSRNLPQRMVVSHPFEKQPLFEIPLVYLSPSLSKLHDDFMHSTDDQQAITFTDNIFEITAEWEDSRKTIVESLNAFKIRLQEAKQKYDYLVALVPGIRMAPGKQAPKMGDIGYNTIHHPQLISPIRIEYLSYGLIQDTKSPTGQSLKISPNPQDIEKMEKIMIQSGLISGKPKAIIPYTNGFSSTDDPSP